jgi:hypothetical protein
MGVLKWPRGWWFFKINENEELSTSRIYLLGNKYYVQAQSWKQMRDKIIKFLTELVLNKDIRFEYVLVKREV